jgi:hypothetical protein
VPSRAAQMARDLAIIQARPRYIRRRLRIGRACHLSNTNCASEVLRPAAAGLRMTGIELATPRDRRRIRAALLN